MLYGVSKFFLGFCEKINQKKAGEEIFEINETRIAMYVLISKNIQPSELIKTLRKFNLKTRNVKMLLYKR